MAAFVGSYDHTRVVSALNSGVAPQVDELVIILERASSTNPPYSDAAIIGFKAAATNLANEASHAHNICSEWSVSLITMLSGNTTALRAQSQRLVDSARSRETSLVEERRLREATRHAREAYRRGGSKDKAMKQKWAGLKEAFSKQEALHHSWILKHDQAKAEYKALLQKSQEIAAVQRKLNSLNNATTDLVATAKGILRADTISGVYARVQAVTQALEQTVVTSLDSTDVTSLDNKLIQMRRVGAWARH
ncbi:hypothetical protein BKA62DRAFT_726175 [Auriculariales sp. MPI-PUGE-AT-0066]|nr:hypothetical protein BKA62DRAFT_726175 [Auriculariales sp. MPI-PUGE-AT-0066]